MNGIEESKIIPKEIDSEVTLRKGLTLSTLFFVIGFNALAQSVSSVIHPKLQVAYLLFSLVVSGILVIPSNKNPQKKLYNCILLSLSKDFTVYHSINREEEED